MGGVASGNQEFGVVSYVNNGLCFFLLVFCLTNLGLSMGFCVYSWLLWQILGNLMGSEDVWCFNKGCFL